MTREDMIQAGAEALMPNGPRNRAFLEIGSPLELSAAVIDRLRVVELREALVGLVAEVEREYGPQPDVPALVAAHKALGRE